MVNRFLDEGRSNSSPPQLRLNEQAVQLGRPLVVDNDCEAGQLPAKLRDKNLAAFDRLGGQGDRLGMGQQGITIFVKRERSAPLEVFETAPLLYLGGPNAKCLHQAIVL